MQKSHEFYMQQALAEAQKAFSLNEVPVGVVIVDADGGIIARAHNLREAEQRATAHAEILAIEQVCKKLSKWRLNDCTLYVTLEPCFMCAGAIVLARIPTVVYGTADPKSGAVKSLAAVLSDTRLNHMCEVISGVCEQECSLILKDFFQIQRKKRNPLETK